MGAKCKHKMAAPPFLLKITSIIETIKLRRKSISSRRVVRVRNVVARSRLFIVSSKEKQIDDNARKMA